MSVCKICVKFQQKIVCFFGGGGVMLSALGWLKNDIKDNLIFFFEIKRKKVKQRMSHFILCIFFFFVKSNVLYINSQMPEHT